MAKKSQFNWPGLRHGEKLSQHTYFALGGPAQYFLSVARSQDLLPVLAEAQKNKIPTLVLGGGSNVAMADKGWSGLVIKFENKKHNDERILLKLSKIPEVLRAIFLRSEEEQSSISGVADGMVQEFLNKEVRVGVRSY